jgi:hypothetical protein
MELREQATGNVITEWEFKTKFPDTSFPQVIDEETFNAFGFDIVFEGPQATPDTVYKFSQREGVEQIDGKWFTKFISGPVFNDNEQSSAQVQEEAYKASMDAVQASKQRSYRAQLLKDCDWTQITDAPSNKEAWRIYRQELRDVTTQEGFPWNVTWPVSP